MPTLRSFPERSFGRILVPSRFQTSGGIVPLSFRVVFRPMGGTGGAGGSVGGSSGPVGGSTGGVGGSIVICVPPSLGRPELLSLGLGQ